MKEAFKLFGNKVEGSPTKLDDFLKVLVARHPLTRLVSAYWSKIGPKGWQNPFFDPISRKMAEHFRGKTNKNGKF